MGPNLESEFQSMMDASYEEGWRQRLERNQILGMRLAFMGGAVAALSQIPIDVVEATPLRQELQGFLLAVQSGQVGVPVCD